MKAKAIVSHLLVVISLIGMITDTPLAVSQPAPSRAALSAMEIASRPSTAQQKDAAPLWTLAVTSKASLTLDDLKNGQGGRSQPGGRSEVERKEVKRAAMGSADPIGPRPIVTEIAAGSFDGDLRDLPEVKFDANAPARVVPEPSALFDLKGVPSPDQPAERPINRNVQRSIGGDMPAPLMNFAGISAAESPYLPPDTNGDVGPRYYIQYVNVMYSIYDKTTGVRVVSPRPLSALFSASQAPCNSGDDGDPLAVYDALADRWLLTEFALPNYPDGPTYQCIAISKSGDPVTGGWWTYVLPASTTDIDGNNMAINDYPKLSVWPDAYYLTANMFPTQNTPVYVRVWALDRARMLAGRPIRTVFFDVFDAINMLPGNVRGDTPPPGSPEFLMAAQSPDKLNVWQFHVDFENPAFSTLIGPTSIPIDPFYIACDTVSCVPQGGTTVRVESHSPLVMYSLQYRRVRDTESLWATQTISDSGKTALRWYEVQLTRGSDVITPTLFQHSTFNPADGVWRWLPSIAADKDGNAAIGYSASSPSLFPQIRYAGRLATDPLNQLAQGEFTMTVGGGSQLRSDAPRWGDYSAMTIDPVDDCTFWYTNEYYVASSQQTWSTRIGSFKYPSCAPQAAMGYITGTVYDAVTSAPLPQMPVMAINAPLTRTFSAATDASGRFTLTVRPGSYSLYGGPLTPNYPVAGAVGPLGVTSGNTTTINIAVQPYPALTKNSVIVIDPAPAGNGNGYVEPGESLIRLMIGISNTGTVAATKVNAQLMALTPGVTVVTPTVSYSTIASGAIVTNSEPFGISIDGGLACGTVLQFAQVMTSEQRTFTVTYSLNTQLPPSLSPIVNTYISTDVPKSIPDDSDVGVDSVITVTDDYVIGKAVVGLTILHTFDSDLQIRLVNPAGTPVDLSLGNGGSLDNYVQTFFDDDAATAITAGTPPFTGSYRPQSPLSVYALTSAAGVWKLHAVDVAAQDVGTIVTWTLKLTPVYCAYPVPKLKLFNAAFDDIGSNNNGIVEPGENSIDVLSALQNSGTADATGVSAVMIPQVPNVSMNNANVAYPDIAVSATITGPTPFNFAVSPSFVCGVPIDMKLNESTARGNFSQRFSLPTGQGPYPAFAFFDNAEVGPDAWLTGTTYAGWGWQITPEDSHSPPHSWTDSPGGSYPSGASATLISPRFDFSAYDDVTLSFWHTYSTELSYDYGYVDYSVDGGATWAKKPLAAYTGSQITWTQVTLDLAPLAHQANARFRFRLASDSSIVYDGWHIDDVQVTGLKRLCNPLSSDWQRRIYVNGVLTTTNPTEVLAGDTVTIVDGVHVTSTNAITFAAINNWSAVTLNSYALTGGSVLTTSDMSVWTVNNLASNDHTLTMTFKMPPGYASGTITGSLWVDNGLPLYPDRAQQFTISSAVLALPARSLTSIQPPNRQVVRLFSIGNLGTSPLSWSVFEFPLGPQLTAPLAIIVAPATITTTFSEGFDDINTLPGKGWALINQSSPLGIYGWFQGTPSTFAAQSGAPNSYIGANYQAVNDYGTISNWLLTPELLIKNGDRIAFHTRTIAGSPWADRLELRLSLAGASTDVGTTANSVGVFTTTLLTINPALVVGGYPEAWTVYTLTMLNINTPTTGRFAFRYFVPAAGQHGLYSNYIGIDTFKYVAAPIPCTSPTDVPWLSITPTGGLIANSATRPISVTFDSTGLARGTYYALLCLSSNDLLQPSTQVPVTLIVAYRTYWPIMLR